MRSHLPLPALFEQRPHRFFNQRLNLAALSFRQYAQVSQQGALDLRCEFLAGFTNYRFITCLNKARADSDSDQYLPNAFQ